ncbi:hypothetical protein QQS21_002080 [Conoideocrella luteorostrata]|uniref:Major facilitator superfamily (MFS) profile domain-containing protein n=1 Tax=Conoideocrella luteorostrata TaxID=1105319 RepID=A0AAJ0CVP4_9HYPO|nr:hypothetical protein QQS21_002080 [Conoideocrella luteorostrata]
MVSDVDNKPDNLSTAAAPQCNDIQVGKSDTVNDSATAQFYGTAIQESYRLKSEIVARALSEIGTGKFQWYLFIVNGCGWMCDNFWSQGITAVRPPVQNEFEGISRLSFSSIAYYSGLIVGAFFWGTVVDIFGRKLAFNATILYGGIFGAAVAGSQNFLVFCCLWAVVGTAAGGNVPVDSIVFLEFVPQSHQWLLVTLSGWWNLGQLVVSSLSWGFLRAYACPPSTAPCPASENMGWRYTMITLGVIAITVGLVRIFVFRIPESPRYLISKGRDADAVEAVNYIARYNGKPEPLTIEMFGVTDENTIRQAVIPASNPKLTLVQSCKESFKGFSLTGYRKLFSGRKLARHTSITFLIWLTIGIAYPLYFAFITSYLEKNSNYPADKSFDHTYMVYCIVSAVGVVGPIAAGFLVETRFGRRWMMAISAALTGVFLFAFTAAKTEAGNIGFQCATAILGNFEYAVMFAFTPESFPGPIRGTGTGIAATLLRIGGLVASFISTYSGYTTVPIYVSAALWILVGGLALGLPYETHGQASI